MPRRPPPTPLILTKGPIVSNVSPSVPATANEHCFWCPLPLPQPPRGMPRHQLPDIPCAALIVTEPAHRHPFHNAGRLQTRERSTSQASTISTSSLSSNISSSFSLSSSDDLSLVPAPVRARAASSGMTMSSSWVGVDAARRQVVPPPPVMLAYPSVSASRIASGSGVRTRGESGSRRVSF
jgi:hypothetical protein